jgi:hypothetical protein
MNSSRLAILAVVAVGIGIVAATQTCRERPPTDAKTEPVATAEPAGGVAPRAADTPMDLRERDRQQDDEARNERSAVPGATTPEAAPELEPTPPTDDRDRTAPIEQPTVVGPPGSPTVEAAMAAAKAAAQDEVAKVRGEMRSKCWNTVDRGGISEAKLGFSLSFDAEGKVLASAVQQQRDSYITGLDTCLGPFAHAIAVPAPGEPVSIEVEVELP